VAETGQYFRDALLHPLSGPDSEYSKHLLNVGQSVTDVHGAVFRKTVLFRFVNLFIPAVRTWGWKTGIVFINISPQLLPHTSAAALVCFSYG
jgi:hypothetical protein